MDTTRRKDKTDPGKVRRIVITVVLILLALAALVIFMQKRVQDRFTADHTDDTLSAEVTRGSISTSVSGTGTLQDDDVEVIDFPKSMELNVIHVKLGDLVREGDLLASVNLNTVLTAMNELKEAIDDLDDEIVTASKETVSSTVSSTVTGRVKSIYAQKGDSVIAVMGEKGALCELSMDGTLSFDVPAGSLHAGDSVTVEADGKSYRGSVKSLTADAATVTVTDNGPLVGSVATAKDADGSTLGSGELRISAPLRIIGYAGTVSNVYTAENRSVYVGSPLFSLTDTAYTANYDTLLKQRQDKEAEMQDLVKIYRSGGLYAPFSGTVKSIDAVEGTPEKKEDGTLPQQSFSVSPDATMTLSLNVDESDILSIAMGQEAVIKLDSLGGQTFPGTVRFIDRVGTSSNGVTTYTADIELQKVEGMLSGMSASATVTIEDVEDTLVIPRDALQKTSTSYYVYTARDEKGTLGGMKEVTPGISNANFVEIVSGLSEGETVYYAKAQDAAAMLFGRNNGRNAAPGGNNRPGGNNPGGMGPGGRG